MQHLCVFLAIVIMAGSLCAMLWDMQPEERLRQTQEERVYKAATVIFH